MNGYTEGAAYGSKKLAILNQILQEAVRRNRLNVAKLVMKYGASMLDVLSSAPITY